MIAPSEILYRPRGAFPSNRGGAHSSSEVGGFGVFRDHTPFLRHPDARRIDVRASLRDPFEGAFVRRFELRSGIEVVALVDFSASMACEAEPRKFDVARDLCATIGYSSTRIGDRFSVVAAGRKILLNLPPTRSRSASLTVARSLAVIEPHETGCEGLLRAAERLSPRRKLVFVISDFHWPSKMIRKLFDRLSMHDLAPIVLVEPAPTTTTKWGLVQLADSEGGGKRIIFMRPALARRWAEQEAERRQEIVRLATARGRRPLFLEGGVDPVALSAWLLAA